MSPSSGSSKFRGLCCHCSLPGSEASEESQPEEKPATLMARVRSHSCTQWRRTSSESSPSSRRSATRSARRSTASSASTSAGSTPPAPRAASSAPRSIASWRPFASLARARSPRPRSSATSSSRSEACRIENRARMEAASSPRAARCFVVTRSTLPENCAWAPLRWKLSVHSAAVKPRPSAQFPGGAALSSNSTMRSFALWRSPSCSKPSVATPSSSSPPPL
mmetsp:Transcript_128196/g.356736  ORF Transcript_128196/g.356736 Transcript_128196/m.356736 type:complete len:222 (-) Transcript_128196:880-1545(-)